MEQIVPLLEQLATQLNTTVEFLWDVLLYQARIEVIKFIIHFILFSVFTAGTINFYKYVTYRKSETDNEARILDWNAALVLIGIINGVWLFSILFDFGDTLGALLNPEY